MRKHKLKTAGLAVDLIQKGFKGFKETASAWIPQGRCSHPQDPYSPCFTETRACMTLAFVMFLMFAITTQASPGNDVMQQGADAYEQERLEEAAAAFREALALAEEDETLDPAAARLNLGTTLARGGQFEPAAAELSEALKTDDLKLQARAQYNLGHVRYREAENLVEQQDLQTANSKIDQSIGHFQDALRLDPADLQTKKNFELSHLKKKQIEALIEQQPPQPEQQQNEDQEEEEQQDQQEDQEQQQSQDPQDQQDQQDQQDEQDQQEPPQDDPQQPEDTPPEEQENGQEEPEPQPAPEQMTEEEAEMLLEAMKEEEQRQREKYRIQLGRPQPVDKDW